MQAKDRHEQQLSLEDLLTPSPQWSELPTETRKQVVDLIVEMLREHVTNGAQGGTDE
jgi:hypothetical protein